MMIADAARRDSDADSQAIVPHRGDSLNAIADAWALLPEDERRRRAVQACVDHDAGALSRIALAWLADNGRRHSGVSPYTQRNYAQSIADLVHAWRSVNLLHPPERAAKRWVSHLEAAGKRDKATGRPCPLAPSTVKLRVAAARTLYAALRDARATTADPFKDIHAASDPTPRHEKRKPYPDADVDRLLVVAEGDDRLLVLLGAHAGLRIAEILALRWEHIDPRAGELRVERGKGGKDRTVPLSSTLAAELGAQRPPSGVGTILPYRSSFSARYRLQALAARAGVPYRGLHSLRHTAGTRLVAETGSIELAAGLLGHSSLDTARVYAKWSDKGLRAVLGGW